MGPPTGVQWSNNPMRVVNGVTTPVTLFNHWARIHHFEFQKAASGDTCSLTDLLGNHVWDSTQESDLDPIISQLIGDVDGLIVTGFSSSAGELLIYFL